VTVLRAANDTFHKSDTGRQRRSNEDREFARAPLFAVADGMGGARAGEVASKIVVETLEEGLPDGGSNEERLAAVVREANARIHELAQSDADRAGMGTTVTAAVVGDDAVSVAHVGDSRAYRIRDGELERLTTDHSLVGELVRRGRLTEEEAEEHPQKSVITRALGPEAAVEVDTRSYPARPGDIFLLCSDGLTGMVSDDRILEVVTGAESLREAGQALIREANENGGRDNITVVLFRLEEVAGAAADGDDRPTQVGMAAPTAEQIEEARAASAPPRRTLPLPRRETEPERPRRVRRRIRGLGPALVLLAILAVLGAGAWVASRAVYFVGVDNAGFVTIYRGLPYEGPGGVDIYQEYYTSGVPASELPRGRRQGLLDHQLRSQQDAADLVRKLELDQVVSE
jgi:serine/threonine protein phosphatase PrpC